MEKYATAPHKERIVWLDLVKVMAIFMMIAVHCTDNVTPEQRSEPWYLLWGSLYGTFMRPAIPLFVMATGALLLPVKQNITAFYSRRMGRIVVPFLVWSLLYNLFPWVTGLLGLNPEVVHDFFVWAPADQSWTETWKRILMIPLNFSPFAIQMWYVYLLIGLYLYLPFFSAWVKQASLREQQLFLTLWFISLFIPYLREFLSRDLWGTCSWNEFGLLYYFAGFNGYLLLGYYLKNNIPPHISWKKLALWGLPLFAAGYEITYCGFQTMTAVPGQSAERVELFFTYCSPNVLMMTLPIFLAAKNLTFHSTTLTRILTNLSACTLGIWMTHYLFLGPCYDLVDALPLHTMCKLILSTLLLLGVTWAFVALVRKAGKAGRWIVG